MIVAQQVVQNVTAVVRLGTGDRHLMLLLIVYLVPLSISTADGLLEILVINDKARSYPSVPRSLVRDRQRTFGK